MSKTKDEDLNVPARVADGWGYVVTLEGGKERYLHSTQPLSRIKDALRDAFEHDHPLLEFDGARFSLEAGDGDLPMGPDCAGFVVVSKILGISYAGPIDRLAIEETSRRFEQLADQDDADAEAEARAEAEASGETDENLVGNADAEKIAFGVSTG